MKRTEFTSFKSNFNKAISNLKNNCSNKKPRKERHKGHKYFLNVRDGISLVQRILNHVTRHFVMNEPFGFKNWPQMVFKSSRSFTDASCIWTWEEWIINYVSFIINDQKYCYSSDHMDNKSKSPWFYDTNSELGKYLLSNES